MQTSTKGRVYLVGAGPGDPELITLKACRLLQEADVVVYDYLANSRLLQHAHPAAEKIYVGKQAGKHAVPQEQINMLLIQKGQEGKSVVRLKGGDPFVFGRGGEEALALRQSGIACEVVPGVTAGTAALAYAGIPATHRGAATSVSFITGHEDPSKPESEINWDAIAAMHGSLVFYMGVNNAARIARELQRFGKPADTPAAVVRCGTLPTQQTLTGTLGTIADAIKTADMQPPALIVVGEVVNLRKELNWFETRPLFGKRIVVTRSRAQASDLITKLELLGAEVLEFPTIKITPPDSWEDLDRAVRDMSSFDWVVFSSANSAQMFFERIAAAGLDARTLAATRVCAVGPATAELVHSFGIIPDLLPDRFTAEATVEAFNSIAVSGKRVLIPRADIGRATLSAGLSALGASVHAPTAYRTVIDDSHSEDMRNLLRGGDFDMVTFTSSSTVKNFVSGIGPEHLETALRRAQVACIGPRTEETARSFNIVPAIRPGRYTIADLADEIAGFYRGACRNTFKTGGLLEKAQIQGARNLEE